MATGMAIMVGDEYPEVPSYGLRPVWWGLVALFLVLLALWLSPEGNHPAMIASARLISGIGNTLFLAIGYIALTVYCLRRRAWANLRAIFSTLVLVTLVVHVQKYGFGHWLSRPSGALGGFPSGHAAAACALAFLIAMYFPRWALGAYGMAVAICWSRIPVGAHWSYQVVVGSVTGYVLALAITDKMMPYSRHHRLIMRWQHALVWLIPLLAVGYTHHEYEDGGRTLWYTLLPITAGLAIRLRQYALLRPGDPEPVIHRWRQRYWRYFANTLTCAGVTMGTEIVWLVPLEVCLCLTVYALVERGWRSEPRPLPVDARKETPSVRASGSTRGLLAGLPQREWIFELSWVLLLGFSALKEILM
jgi:membrane-associated phospholipid phosphatase